MSENGILEKLTEFYSGNFEFEYNLEAAGITVPVSAYMHNRQQKQIFGMSLKGLGPEARERIFFLKEQSFGMEAMSRLEELMAFAEREYVRPDRNHAFTFISVVVIAEAIEQDAAAMLKKYKLRKNYRSEGWSVVRAVVFGANGESVCSKDGVDLKKMLQKAIAQS